MVSVGLSTGAAVWTRGGAGGGGTTGFGEAIGDGAVICPRITAASTLPRVALTTTAHRGRRAFDGGTGGNSIFGCRRAAGSPRTDGEIEEGRTDIVGCSRRRTPGSSGSNCRSGSSSPEATVEVSLFFFGGNCRSSGCIVFRELHVTTLGAHSPSTCEQPQGQSSFHTWLWFAAHFAASACAEVTQGEALLLDFTIEDELPASRRCRTPRARVRRRAGLRCPSSPADWTTPAAPAPPGRPPRRARYCASTPPNRR